MPRLLVQACSKSKQTGESAMDAFDLYTGYYFKIIKKAMRDEQFDNTIELRILSAKHGLISPDEQIEPYDRRMDSSRASELRAEVLTELVETVTEEEHEQVIVNVGQDYAEAVAGLETRVDVPVTRLGGGLGERGAQLKRLVRGRASQRAEA